MPIDAQRELITILADLAPVLDRVLVSATVTAQGRLDAVHGLSEKVAAARERDTLHAIHAVALARAQTTADGKDLASVTDFKQRIVGTSDYLPTSRQPLVLANDLGELARTLCDTLDEAERFGQRLGLPAAVLDDERYSARQYFGRAWLRGAIARFIATQQAQHSGGYIVVAADAIWGKTAFALDWYRRTTEPSQFKDADVEQPLPSLAGWAFIRKDTGGKWADPIRVLLGLEAETRYQRSLPTAEVPNPSDFYQNDFALETHFHGFLEELGEDTRQRSAHSTARPAVLLLDGLDEIWGPSGEAPSSLLPGALPRQLPEGVFIVLLSRPGYHLHWKRGAPTSPCLIIDMAATMAGLVAEGGDEWLEQSYEDLANYLEWRITRLNQQYQFDLTDQLQALKPALLKAAQGYLFVLSTLLAPADDLPERIRQWAQDPGRLPQGPRQLVARVITRIVQRVEAATDPKLDRISKVSQVLAGLGLTACLRQPLGIEALSRLLFDDKGQPAVGALPLSGRCGSLRWNQLDEDVLKAALSFGAECFVGSRTQPLPRSTTFWHPEMRHLVRAAWQHGTSYGGAPTESDLLTAATALQPQGVAEAERPLHLFLAAASFRYWRAGIGGSLDGDSEARAYALAWGPWHAVVSGDERALQEAAEALIDPVYLQAAYTVLGAHAHHAIDATFEAVLQNSEGIGAQLTRRLWNVRRVLSQHDDLFSENNLPVAATLYNDLGGLEAEGSMWRQQLFGEAKQRTQLVRRQPGAPSPLLRWIRNSHRGKFFSDCFAISPDGHWIAIFEENEIRLFRVEAGGYRVILAATIVQPTGDITTIALCTRTDGGLWLASGADDGMVGLLSIGADGTPTSTLTRIEGHAAKVNHVAFSPLVGGRLWLASGADDGMVGLLSIGADGTPMGTLTRIEGHAAKVNHVAFSPLVGGRLWLASGADDGMVGLLSIGADGNPTSTLTRIEGHSAKVNHLAFSPLVGSRLWLAGAADGVGLLAIDADGTYEHALTWIEGSAREVNHVAFSPPVHGRLWLASGDANEMRLWAIDVDCAPEHALTLREEELKFSWGHGIAFSPLVDDRLWLARGFADGVRLLAIDIGGVHERALTRIEGHAGWVRQVAFSPLVDGKLWLACGAMGGDVGFWSIGTHKDVRPAGEEHTNSVTSVAISPIADGRLWLASAACEPCVGVLAIDADGGHKHVLTQIEVHSYLSRIKDNVLNFKTPVSSVAFSPLIDGKLWLAIGAFDHVSLLAISVIGAQASPLTLIEHYGEDIPDVAFSPWVAGQSWVAITGGNSGLNLIAINADGTHAHALTRIERSARWVNHVAFSTVVGAKLWLASADGEGVGLIAIGAEFAHEHAMERIEGHTVGVNHVAFSPQVGGRLWLASAGDDGVCLLAIDADAMHASAMTRIEGHSGRVRFVAFSPEVNGRLWLAISADYGIGLVTIGADGRYEHAVTRTDGHDAWMKDLFFSPVIDDRLLLAGASDCKLCVWSVPECRLVGQVDYSGTGEKIHEMRWAADGRMLYVAGSRGTAPVDLTLLIPDALFSNK